jgi:hypothetical protein
MMPESLPRRFWPEDEWPAAHGARGARCQAEMDSRRARRVAGGCEAKRDTAGWQGKEAYADGTLVR